MLLPGSPEQSLSGQAQGPRGPLRVSKENPRYFTDDRARPLNGGLDEKWEPVRAALGHTRRFAERINLAALVPHPELAGTAFR